MRTGYPNCRKPDIDMDADSWRWVKEVLAEALKRPKAEREAYVLSLNLPAEIRDKSLEIISAYEDSTEFLRSKTPIPIASDDAELLHPGARVGQYEIVDQIGAGGMGRVYLAKDPRLHRKVALKCLIGMTDASIINEAIAAAQINHPNVAAVYDVIEHRGRVFIVMEYVDGENLASRLHRERLSVSQAVSVGQRLASALAAAHAKGIIHRDLKPGNVQFTYDGTPKVLDFGIANLAMTMTVTSRAATTGPAKVAEGPHPGTPPYMSPEQLRGQALDERSDIFSLGVLLFEMATGRRPFPSGDQQEIIELHTKGAPRADGVDTKIPRVLADVIAQTLDTDRLRRPQAAREVEASLEEVARRIRPKVIGELIRRWLTRVAVGVPIALVGMVLAGFIVTVGFNVTFGRDAEFARFGGESLTSYFRWGVLAIFPSLVVMAMAAVVLLFAGAAYGVLEAAGPFGRRLRAWRMNIAAGIHETRLDTSSALARTLAGFGVVAIVLLFWRFSDLVNAWSALVNSAPIARLVPIGPQAEARAEYHTFQLTLQVLTVILALGLVRVLQLRRAEKAAEGIASVVALGAALSLIMVTYLFTYRTMNHRDMPRADLAGSRCYVTGEAGDELLIFCPQNAPPRNRAVRRGEQGLTLTGAVENVFETLRPSRSGS